MLTHFKVSNYKCLVDVELPLTPIHVIIGQNDSGKTSLLEAMFALSRSSEVDLVSAFTGDWRGRELVYSEAVEPIINLEATYRTPGEGQELEYGLNVAFTTPSKQCSSPREWILMGGAEQLPPGGGGNSTRIHAWRQGHYTQYPACDIVAGVIAPASYYRLEPKSMAFPAVPTVARKFRLGVDGFGLPTLLDDITGDDPERFLALRREFCEHFPQFRKVGIETQEAYDRDYDANGVNVVSRRGQGKEIFFETINGAKIRAQQASDGAILFLGLLALMYAPNPPKLLLIEEPEKGVYPLRLEEIVRLIRRLHENRPAGTVPQIIMTTHSPYLLSFFQPEEVTFLSRRDKTGPVRARPLRDAPHIHDRLAGGAFYLGELWYNLSEEDLFGDA